MILTFLDRYREIGLAVLRIGIGLCFAFLHGFSKMFSGPEGWEGLAEAGGIPFAQVFFGFMGAFSEFFGGLFIAAGWLFRPALFLAFCTMMVAIYGNIQRGNNFSHALELAIVFAGLFLTGPGRYSVDAMFTKPKLAR
ncbi:MAG: DoxX family protein [Bacteroidota bacterium]